MVETVENCSACGLCEALCPKDAIEMKWSQTGFLSPSIQVDRCINCGLCLKKCPQSHISKSDECFSEVKAYGGWNTNDSIHEQSSSGGVFSAVSDYVLERNGVVYGVVWNKELIPVFSRITKREEMAAVRGSKYTQALPQKVYRKVQNDLKEGKLVLFSGTPCQVYALNLFLRKIPENLITVDIVCHGIPSRTLFQKYVREAEQAKRKKVVRVSFREKPEGWKRYHVTLYYSDGSRDSLPSEQDPYMRLFLSDKALKPACYDCKYAVCPRPGDITLGDFWGVENFHKDWPLERGISAILTNTQKGAGLLSLLQAEDRICIYPEQFEHMRLNQSGFSTLKNKPCDYQSFMKDLLRLSVRQLVLKYIDSVAYGPLRVRINGKMHHLLDMIHSFWLRVYGYTRIKLGLLK